MQNGIDVAGDLCKGVIKMFIYKQRLFSVSEVQYRVCA